MVAAVQGSTDTEVSLLFSLEGDWDVEPQQAWSAASESSLNPMSRLEDVSQASGISVCFGIPCLSFILSRSSW